MLTQLQLLHRQLYSVHCSESETTWHRIFIYSILGPLSRAGHAHPRNDHATTAAGKKRKNNKPLVPRRSRYIYIYIKRHGNKQQLFVYSRIKIVTLCDNCGESAQLGWHCTYLLRLICFLENNLAKYWVKILFIYVLIMLHSWNEEIDIVVINTDWH